MITKPSVQDLLHGLIRNFETATAGDDSAVEPILVPALAVLDRVVNEWHSWPALLAQDNTDIRQTLEKIGACVPDIAPKTSRLDSRDSAQAVTSLEAENRQLKDALVEAIETFDLPATAGDNAERQAIDREILSLLRRMLYREDEVQVAPGRTAPTSGNPASSGLSLTELEAVLGRFLSQQIPEASNIDIRNLAPLAGGASREAWVFDVSWTMGSETTSEPCILMREPIASVLVSDESNNCINGTRRTSYNEIRVIRAMERAGLPVPAILWNDAEGRWLERPFSIARRLPGTADATQIDPRHAEALLDQYVEILSLLHQLEPHSAGVDFLGDPTADSAAIDQVAQFERNFHEQRLEAFPATTYLIRWLKKNAPEANRVSIVHGDYRLGNFLFEDDQLIAILDWEQVHVGDPAEEIAFMYWALWSLEALCPIETFVRRYEQKSGIAIDADSLAYYRMFIEFKMLIVLLTGLKSYFATDEYQLHYGSSQTPQLIRQSQLRAIEELYKGGPTVAFNAYQANIQGR